MFTDLLTTKFDIWVKIIPTLEILILWFVFYRLLIFFEGSRAFQVLIGITYLLVAFIASKLLGLNTLNWLLERFFAISIVAFLIIFQQELRQGLARLGQQHFFNVSLHESEIIAIIDEVTSAVVRMARQKTGCLIAIEREVKLNTYIESGVEVDSKISSELLQTIFTPPSPLHDGGIITRLDRIVAASCLFPLSENPNFSKIIGTRHRAALGLSEQSDAVIILASEETGDISVAHDGRFVPVANQEQLVATLKNLLVHPKKKRKKK
jgi:diadenylate cyclase